MKITAVTEDQIILIDGIPAFVGEIGGYHMTRGEWALHFDTDIGHGEIEYIDNRPNQRIDNDIYHKAYTWLETEHARYLTYAAELKAEAEREQQTITDTTQPNDNRSLSNEQKSLAL